MPNSSYNLLMESMNKGHIVSGIEKFEKEIIFTLRNIDISEISNLPDVNEGLEYNIKDAINHCNTLTEFISLVKSKRYTRSRINRILLYALLGITKQDIELSKKIPPYIRVLGFNSKGQQLLSEIFARNDKLQIITSVKGFTDECKNKKILSLLEKDIHATNIYTLGYEKNSNANLDYTTKIITYK